MDKVSIHPNLFLIKACYGVVGILGMVMVASYITSYWNGDFPWNLINLSLGIILMGEGFGSSFGYFEISYPSVKVSENRVETEGTNWPRTFEFEKVKRIELTQGKIEAEYKSTGNKDSIRIPFMLRRKDKLTIVKNALESRCRQSGVEFSAALT